MASLEENLQELEYVKQAFKDNFDNYGVSTSGVEFRNMPNLLVQMEKILPSQVKEITPTTERQVANPDKGFKLTGVVVNAVTSAIDENIQPENIKKDVAILGVVGTMEATSGSPKFAELVDGSIVSVESGDLADVIMIRNNAFANLTDLTSAVIPSNIATIGDGAFMGCSSLQALLIAEGVQSIGSNAFNGTAINTLIIPKSVMSIGKGAFANSQVTEVTMEATTPPSVTDTTFPESVTAIYVPRGTYYTYVESWGYYADKIVTDFDVEEIPNETGITLNIISNDYREILNEQNGYTLEIGG